MEKEFPKRKPTRLKNFDYSSKGAYFITICVRDRKQILSEIMKSNRNSTDETNNSVGEGLAPPEYFVKLKPCGKIAEEQLHLLENRFPTITLKDYIIMPDHIHAIIFLRGETVGASPSPTLNDVICAFKSLTSFICKQRYGIEKIFQRSSADHIIRDKQDYEEHLSYIHKNPMRWYYEHLDKQKFEERENKGFGYAQTRS